MHCKSAICYTVKFNAVQGIELLILKTFHWSALHRKDVQCNSMDKNIDQCSTVECTAAHPHLIKSPKEEKNPFMFFFFCIVASIIIGREIRCVPFAGFFSVYFYIFCFVIFQLQIRRVNQFNRVHMGWMLPSCSIFGGILICMIAIFMLTFWRLVILLCLKFWRIFEESKILKCPLCADDMICRTN